MGRYLLVCIQLLAVSLFLVLLSDIASAAEVERYVDDEGVVHVRRIEKPSTGASVTIIKKNEQRIANEPSGEKCIVNKIHVKELGQSYGFVDVSFKADVQNFGAAGSCYVAIQGVDGDGYEVLSQNMRGNFDVNAVSSLSERRTYSADKYVLVRQWMVKEVSKSRLR